MRVAITGVGAALAMLVTACQGSPDATAPEGKTGGQAHPWSASPWAALSGEDVAARQDALTPLECQAGEVCPTGPNPTAACFITFATDRYAKDIGQTFVPEQEGWATTLRLVTRRLREPGPGDAIEVYAYRIAEGERVPTDSALAFAGGFLEGLEILDAMPVVGVDADITVPFQWNPHPDLRITPQDEEGNPTRLAFTVSASPGLLAFGTSCFNGDVYPDGQAHSRLRRTVPPQEGQTAPVYSTGNFTPYARDLVFAFGISETEPSTGVTVREWSPTGDDASLIAQVTVRFSSNVRASSIYQPGVTQNIEVEGPPGFDTSYAYDFNHATAEARLHFLNQLPPESEFTVRIKGGPSGVQSTSGIPLFGNAAGGGTDFVWTFSTRKAGDRDPWIGGIGSGASVSRTPSNLPLQYTLFSVTGSPEPITVEETGNGSYRLNAGFFHRAHVDD